MKNSEQLILIGILVAYMFIKDKNAKTIKIREQMMNRFTEFFEGNDLHRARLDYLDMLSHYTPEQSFDMVIIKGGGEL
jgi:hypothetical protein